MVASEYHGYGCLSAWLDSVRDRKARMEISERDRASTLLRESPEETKVRPTPRSTPYGDGEPPGYQYRGLSKRQQRTSPSNFRKYVSQIFPIPSPSTYPPPILALPSLLSYFFIHTFIHEFIHNVLTYLSVGIYVHVSRNREKRGRGVDTACPSASQKVRPSEESTGRIKVSLFSISLSSFFDNQIISDRFIAIYL